MLRLTQFREQRNFDELRSITQVIIISDTFTQFASPLMKKLGWPTIFCNSLEVADNGEITGFKMRCEQSKLQQLRLYSLLVMILLHQETATMT